MRTSSLTREEALALLRNYNKEPFHIQHGITVEYVMRWYAGDLGYKEEEDYWGSRACSMTLILSSIPRSTAGRRRNCCGKAAWGGYDPYRLFPRLRHLQRY